VQGPAFVEGRGKHLAERAGMVVWHPTGQDFALLFECFMPERECSLWDVEGELRASAFEPSTAAAALARAILAFQESRWVLGLEVQRGVAHPIPDPPRAGPRHAHHTVWESGEASLASFKAAVRWIVQVRQQPALAPPVGLPADVVERALRAVGATDGSRHE
jgi:hypothetical protein